MSDQPLTVGDVITATVTKSVPFGVLVEYAGVPGLVRRMNSEPGSDVRVRVTAYDVDEHRFAAEMA
jgi:ribosomal protein S1